MKQVELKYFHHVEPQANTSNDGFGNQGFARDHSTDGGITPPDYNSVSRTPYGMAARHDSLQREKQPQFIDTALDADDKTPTSSTHQTNGFIRVVERVQTTVSSWYSTNYDPFWTCIALIFAIAYFVYFGYAMHVERLRTEPSVRLLWMTCVVVVIVVVRLIWKYKHRDDISDEMSSTRSSSSGVFEVLRKHETTISWIVVGIVYLAVIIFIIIDAVYITKESYNLVSLAGMVVFLLFLFVFSYSPAHVNWRAVAWGIALQFVFALLILRWSVGYEVFDWIGARVANFLDYTDAGSKFLFGETQYQAHYFAFKVLPTVIFFSAIISALYFLGIMQVVIRGIGGFLERVMGTTTGESLNAAANIFIGQSEAPLVIRPLIKDMTRSELHSVVTGGFATIAGSVLAAYISFNIPANHLISASVMSAPAALAVSKLFYPETEVSRTSSKHIKKMERPDDHNIVDALFSGASRSIKLVANIAVNLIAALAILEFINSTLAWFGERAGRVEPEHDEITLQFICSYLWYPVALFMGVELTDCRKVAELVAVKTFLNEFVAYDELRELIVNKQNLTDHVIANGSYFYVKDDIMLVASNWTGTVTKDTLLEGGILQPRSEVIATYALCGFANIGSMGIMLGALSAIAPNRKTDISSVVVRALIAGNVACFLTACIAGIFYQPFD